MMTPSRPALVTLALALAVAGCELFDRDDRDVVEVVALDVDCDVGCPSEFLFLGGTMEVTVGSVTELYSTEDGSLSMDFAVLDGLEPEFGFESSPSALPALYGYLWLDYEDFFAVSSSRHFSSSLTLRTTGGDEVCPMNDTADLFLEVVDGHGAVASDGVSKGDYIARYELASESTHGSPCYDDVTVKLDFIVLGGAAAGCPCD